MYTFEEAGRWLPSHFAKPMFSKSHMDYTQNTYVVVDKELIMLLLFFDKGYDYNGWYGNDQGEFDKILVLGNDWQLVLWFFYDSVHV